MRAVFLDWQTIHNNDIDRQALLELPVQWTFYPLTSEQQLAERINGMDIVVSNKVRLDADAIDKVSDLKLIVTAATGYDHIDIDCARQKHIPVCNVVSYATDSVAQHTFMLILNLVRNARAYQQAIQTQRWHASPIFSLLDHTIHELQGMKLGIIGYGQTGQAVAQLGRVFGMDILICESLAGGKTEHDRVSRDTLLETVDVLSLHCPLTDKTRNLIDGDALHRMQDKAILINTARGGLVNEQALADALVQGKLAGAGMDVLEVEPPATLCSPLLELDLPQLIITPHIAWASVQARQRLVAGVVSNIQSWLDGTVTNQVNI